MGFGFRIRTGVRVLALVADMAGTFCELAMYLRVLTLKPRKLNPEP